MYGVMFRLWYPCTTELILRKVSSHIFAYKINILLSSKVSSTCSNSMHYIPWNVVLLHQFEGDSRSIFSDKGFENPMLESKTLLW